MRTSDIKKEEQTKGEIIAAAQKILRVYGFDKTTMEDIARASGKGKSSLYYYYKSREELFFAVAMKEMADLQAKVDVTVAARKTSAEKLRALLIERCRGIKSKMVLYSVLLKESDKYIDLFNKIQQANHKIEMESVTKIVADGVGRGEFKGIKKQDIPSLAMMSMLIWHGLALNIIVSGEVPPTSLKIERMADVFIRGLIQY